ncbi:MAG: class II fructose-bisphosphate aldolase [Oscillospiraceae bacterium]|nr:class II fructose-bisphosphate aldolase [Oscillospiraceae bacterium]
MLANGKQAKILFNAAREGHWAIGAFNIMDYNTAEAVIRAAEELDVPVCLQMMDGYNPEAPEGSRFGMTEAEQHNFDTFVINRSKDATVPVILHLDHCPTYEGCMRGLKRGLASLMLDASQLPFDENASMVKKVVEAAHPCGVIVEGEIGHVGGHPNSHGVIYTEVEDAVRYEEATGCDLTAISIGTVHGYYAKEPVLNYDRIAEIREVTKNPLVMHGSSGLREDQFRDAIKAGISKVNFATYIQIAGGKAQMELAKQLIADDKRAMMMQINNAGLNAAKDYVKMHMEIFGTQKVTF